MNIEIEKKYLCNYVPEGLETLRIMQGYVHVDSEKQIRIRLYTRNEKKAVLCIKYNRDGFREEFETPMDFWAGVKLYQNCKHTVKKERCSLRIGPANFDIDKYDNGLTIVEVELPNADTKIALPDFVGESIDGVYQYTNFHLAGIKHEDIL